MSQFSPSLRCAMVAAVLLLPGVSARADEGPPLDILGLYDQFVASGAAASRCAEPTDALALRFLSNFQWVTAYATREIGSRRPEFTSQQVADELATRSREIKANTHAMVKEEGCASEPVQRLVRRFLAQSAWRPESV
ncbi:MAG: hypothetical protein RLZZ393_139 [Pseudomonadota bacterium]|jgi:hypothetical protein